MILLLGMKKVMRAEKFEELTLEGGNRSGSGSRQGLGASRIKEDKLHRDLKSKKSQVSTKAMVLGIVVYVSQTLLVIPTFYLVSTTYNCQKLTLLS
jgi:hypothetical protein